MTVSLLLWCCAGNCWGAYYCIVQSMIALLGASECCPYCHFSHFKHKCKPRPWQKRAHKMRRRRRLVYHLMLRCRHCRGLKTLNGLNIFPPAWRKHKRWKERNIRSRFKYRQRHRHFFQPSSKISNVALHNWCYGDHDFTQLSRLLCSFEKTQQLHEWKNQSTAQSVFDRMNVFRCSLENNAGNAIMVFLLRICLWSGILVHHWV